VGTPDGRILHSSWKIVIASRGQTDHERWVEKFADRIRVVADDARHDAACGGADGVGLKATILSSEAAYLSATVVYSGKAPNSIYEKVADLGNNLMVKLEVNEKF
jgi:hypothetical protein